jgi:hypothetical protein
MSECTWKASGWRAQGKPQDNRELEAYRGLIREVVFSVFREKKELLAQQGMPSQPVSLGEIYLEVRSRVAVRQRCGSWPYRVHGKRWLDRRVNECACPKYSEDGVPKVVAVTAGHYEPNPALFVKPLEVTA